MTGNWTVKVSKCSIRTAQLLQLRAPESESAVERAGKLFNCNVAASDGASILKACKKWIHMVMMETHHVSSMSPEFIGSAMWEET